jgi:pimeloyl-ACP methyl ester carboxylesterase
MGEAVSLVRVEGDHVRANKCVKRGGNGGAGQRRDFGDQADPLQACRAQHGKSVTGDSTMLERSRDAQAALAFLRARPGIAAGSAGLYGFSNGAWSVPMVSGRCHDVGFVVVMGAPGVTPARSEVHRKVSELREQGVPEPECELAATMWELIYGYRRTGAWDDSDSSLFDNAARRLHASQAIAGLRLQQYAIDNPFLSPIPPYRSHRELLQVPPPEEDATDWSYDPAPDYRRTGCPVLFTVGELDQNLPGPESAERVREVLTGPAHRDSLVRVFPGTGHLMNVIDPAGLHGMTSEEASYRFHRFRFAPGFLELLRSWTHTEAQRANSGRQEPGKSG